ncbi:MAG: hypothetical protein VKO39_09905 [Cyanobacteriota bacterium]|nr:hypothetical protein [Cyanobacteriota bacterium]
MEQTSGNRTAPSPSTQLSGGCGRVAGATALSFAARKQRQLLFLLTRQLAEAQFVRADRERTQRLWQEAAALDLDPDRIIHLLYGVADHADRAEMDAVDGRWRPTAPPRRRPWWAPGLGRLMGKGGGAWHQSAPPAALPTCR